MSALAWDVARALQAHAQQQAGRVYADDSMTDDERAAETQRKRIAAWKARKRAEAAALGLSMSAYMRMGAKARKALQGRGA